MNEAESKKARTRWFYQSSTGSTVGPISPRELRNAVLAGEITSETRVRRSDSARWRLAKHLRRLLPDTPPSQPANIPEPVARTSNRTKIGIALGFCVMALTVAGALVLIHRSARVEVTVLDQKPTTFRNLQTGETTQELAVLVELKNTGSTVIEYDEMVFAMCHSGEPKYIVTVTHSDGRRHQVVSVPGIFDGDDYGDAQRASAEREKRLLKPSKSLKTVVETQACGFAENARGETHTIDVSASINGEPAFSLISIPLSLSAAIRGDSG